MRQTLHTLVSAFLILFTISVHAQDYTFDDFVGTWNGTIMNPSTNGSTVPITMTIEANGFYTETSGALMPTLYPNTQQCEYQSATNRMHWWYLGTVWGGQYFYDHFFYEVVYFENGVLEMHYNYWDDPEPHPEVGTIYMVKEGATVMPPPSVPTYDWMDNTVMLTWNVPDPGNGQLAELTGYNIYHQTVTSDFELLGFSETTSFNHEGMFEAGLHSYAVSAVYEEGESEPSDNLDIIFLTPAPESLEGTFTNNSVELTWEAPQSGSSPTATVTGYIIYHQSPNGSYQILGITEEMMFTHDGFFEAGMHAYYAVANYEGGVSSTSNIAALDFMTPAPTELESMLMGENIELTWAEPVPGDEAMATLEGYNVYHMPENGSWEMLAFVESNTFVHENLASTGMQTYYVSAVYNGGMSDPSNQTEVLYQITGISDEQAITANIYPNPATDFIQINAETKLTKVSILNQSGQLISTEILNTNSYRADVRYLQAGVYILLLESAGRPTSQMFVVK